MLAVTDNIAWIEILWTVIGVVGMIFATINYRLAQRSISFLKARNIANGRLFVGKISRTTEAVRFVIQSIEVALGVIAMTLPNGDLSNVPLRFRISAYAIQWGLVACAALTLVQSLNSFRIRRHYLAGD